MADENARPVTEREWKMSLDAHLREHAIEDRHRMEIAGILDSIRIENKAANDLRLEGMNEFRRQLDKQAATFVTTDKYDTQSRAGADAIAAIGKEVDRRLGLVESRQANTDGKMAVYGAVAALVASGVTSLIVYAVTK